MNLEDYWIPRNLEAPPMFFLWEADSVMLVGFWMFMGALLNMFIMGCVLAFVTAKSYAYLKEEGGKGLLLRLCYWYLPSSIFFGDLYPSYRRCYIG